MTRISQALTTVRFGGNLCLGLISTARNSGYVMHAPISHAATYSFIIVPLVYGDGYFRIHSLYKVRLEVLPAKLAIQYHKMVK